MSCTLSYEQTKKKALNAAILDAQQALIADPDFDLPARLVALIGRRMRAVISAESSNRLY